MGGTLSQPLSLQPAPSSSTAERTGAESLENSLNQPQIGAFIGRLVRQWQLGSMDCVTQLANQLANQLVSRNAAVHSVDVKWDGSGNVSVLWSNGEGIHTVAGPLSNIYQWIYKREDALAIPRSLVEYPSFDIPPHLLEEALVRLATWDLEPIDEVEELTADVEALTLKPLVLPEATSADRKARLLAETPWGF